MRIRNGSISLLPGQWGFSVKNSSFQKELFRLVNIVEVKISGILHSFVSMIRERKLNNDNVPSATSFSKKPRFSFRGNPGNSKKLLVGILIIITLIIVVNLAKKTSLFGNSNRDQIEIKGARASAELNREFNFPLINDKGEELSKITYILEKAELRDEIVVEGKRATAIKGRTFLVITLKIANNYGQSIKINSKDYMRLSVNGNKEEWLAPDIHNDPVEVQAISTKFTRLGFPMNDNDRDLVLRVGEIKGNKEEIPLNF